MIKANFNAYDSYVTDSLYQWDLDRVLNVSGLNLAAAPEVHFHNADMERAIVRQATMVNHVVSVKIPNSLLQAPLPIKAYIGIYEGETFKVLETISIPVIPREKPADYRLEGEDEEIYSFNRLENMIEQIDEKWSAFTMATVDNAVNAWLENHPEATTTVQDGALTDAKFSDDLKLHTIKDYVAPEMFGAKGDGITDDTIAFQNAADRGKFIFGKGIYKITDLTLTDVTVVADFKLSGTLNLLDNVALNGNVENVKSRTMSAGGKIINITGENNIVSGVKFTGVYCGVGVLSSDTAKNNTIENCVFEPIFKEDIHVNGYNTIVKNCYFKKHTDVSVSNLTDYSNAIKISYFIDSTLNNGKDVIITGCFFEEHGDNAIDCYSGAENVTITDCHIDTPLHRCIEIKTKSESNHISKNYTIANCIMIGSGLIDFHAETTGAAHSLNNVIINNCHLYNVGETGGIITHGVDKFEISNCIMDANNKNALSCDNDARVVNCHIYNMQMLFTTTDINATRIITGCKLEGYSVGRITESVVYILDDCIVNTTDNTFSNCTGKLILSNCNITSEKYIVVLFANTATIGIHFCKLKPLSYVFGRNSSATTGKTLLLGNIVDGDISDWGLTQALNFN